LEEQHLAEPIFFLQFQTTLHFWQYRVHLRLTAKADWPRNTVVINLYLCFSWAGSARRARFSLGGMGLRFDL